MSNNATLPGLIQDIESKDDSRKIKKQYNSIDYVYSVNRLSIRKSMTTGIYHYGLDNNYPTKLIQISERSGALMTVKEKQAYFVSGLGFPGATANDVKNGTAIQINENGDTAYDLLKFCADEKSNINIAIQVNYNELGEAVDFNMIPYDLVRRKVKLRNEIFYKYVISNIWHLEDYTSMNYNYAKIQDFNQWMQNKEIDLDFVALEIYDYNPDPIIVRQQIAECGGIQNYPGQLL